mmetsp:Transcript_11080/g.17579  ORF Transcript_11080/g.17579 Transcript_11080/m.17579 type:complete len:243 (-) Transcript_11080:61-789(-)
MAASRRLLPCSRASGIKTSLETSGETSLAAPAGFTRGGTPTANCESRWRISCTAVPASVTSPSLACARTSCFCAASRSCSSCLSAVSAAIRARRSSSSARCAHTCISFARRSCRAMASGVMRGSKASSLHTESSSSSFSSSSPTRASSIASRSAALSSCACRWSLCLRSPLSTAAATFCTCEIFALARSSRADLSGSDDGVKLPPAYVLALAPFERGVVEPHRPGNACSPGPGTLGLPPPTS